MTICQFSDNESHCVQINIVRRIPSDSSSNTGFMESWTKSCCANVLQDNRNANYRGLWTPTPSRIANKTGNVRLRQHWDVLLWPQLLWKNNKYYIFWVCVWNLRHPVCKAHAPYYTIIYGPTGCIMFFHIISIRGWFSEKKLLNLEFL
jgi:hypothetical protein